MSSTTTRVLALVSVATLGSSACTSTLDERSGSSESSIVGGTEAAVGAWPGVAALFTQGQQFCGGSLVADEWVITAGHCVISPGTTKGGIDEVVVGRHRLSSTDGERIPVREVFRHERFNDSTLDNDIALVHLARPTTVQHANLVSAAQMAGVGAGTSATVVGWGVTRENGATSDVLRQVAVPILDRATCADWYRPQSVTLTDDMICAGLEQGGVDSCQGDSGGPLFATFGGQPVQIGVVSFGIGCARPKAPGVYTNVVNHLAWLATKSGGAIGAGGGAGPVDAGTHDAGGDGGTSGTDASTSDGSVGAPRPARGEISVTEVMYAPSTPEPSTEWIEVHNLAARPRSLSGLSIVDGAGRTHVIGTGVEIGPGVYGLLVRDRSAAIAAKVPSSAILYAYGDGSTTAGIQLSNGARGAVELRDGATSLVRVAYGQGLPRASGGSIQLDEGTSAWCASTSSWAPGSDFGTPGASSDCR